MRVHFADLQPGKGTTSGWPSFCLWWSHSLEAHLWLSQGVAGEDWRVSGLTWYLWHPAEFEVTHIGTQGKAMGPCENSHSRTKLSVKDPGI